MNYHKGMQIECDKAKSDSCFEQRGFDFAYVTRVFLDPNRLVRQDHRWDYGEDRFLLMGK